MGAAAIPINYSIANSVGKSKGGRTGYTFFRTFGKETNKVRRRGKKVLPVSGCINGFNFYKEGINELKEKTLIVV